MSYHATSHVASKVLQQDWFFSYSHMHRDKIMMLADGNGQFTKAIGAELDLTDKGLGLRSRRYAMLVEDQVVKVLNLEEGGAFTISSADSILEALASK
jgi:peroxiredoxin